MVKVAAPALSLDASGSIAGAVTFSKWKGRNYVRQLVKPSNPQSGGQVGVRAMFKFLSQRWADLTTAEKATWDDYADQLIASGFNAFMSRNQFRFRNWLAPTVEEPAAEVGTVATSNGTSATGGVRQVTIGITPATAINDQWGVMIFRSTSTGFSTAFSNCVQIIKANTLALYEWVDTPLAADTYYYNYRAFTVDGVLGSEIGEDSAAAT
jgi:hypothetical protein